MLIGKVNNEDFSYTVKKAVESTKYWNKKFGKIEINPVDLEDVNKINILPKELYDIKNILPKYILNSEIFHTILQTSGTGGVPKQIPFTKDEEKRIARQIKKWVKKYVEKGDIIVSFFPPLPSASGVMSFEAMKCLEEKVRFYQLPPQLFSQKELLLSTLEKIKPTSIWALTTSLFNLSEMISEKIKKDIKFTVVGGEELAKELAEKISSNLNNSTIIDVYGNAEDAATGYKIYEKGSSHNFIFPESCIVLKQEYEDYYKMYLSKLVRKGELAGVWLFNYDIGDLAKVENSKVVGITRAGDCINLAGAKLFLSQISEVIHKYPNLHDYIVIYQPLSPENPEPKATIRIGYSEKVAGIEDEIRLGIYEINNPVRYEVEDSKMAKLIIEAVPQLELRKDLPFKPGKPKRLFIKGKDL